MVVGAWTNKNDLTRFKEQIINNKLSKQIKVIKDFKPNDMPEIISKSLLFVHPNQEAFSLSALEAASYGLPIVIPSGSGVTDLFTDKKHGLFPKNNRKSIIEAVEYLVKNPQKANQMGKEAAKFAKIFSWRKHTLIVSKYINKTLKNAKQD